MSWSYLTRKRILLPTATAIEQRIISSGGTAITALPGRNIRLIENGDKDCDFILAHTAYRWRVRSYRVEYFREALANSSALLDTAALGAYQLNRVCAVTINIAEATKKSATLKALKVKRRRVLIFVELRLH